MRRESQLGSKSGFTLVELVIVMAVIAVILGMVIPNLRGMQASGQLTKCEGDLKTMKSAITSYWRNNGNVYPAGLEYLPTASPQILPIVPTDPFNTMGTGVYGYITGNDGTFGDWFLVCTAGPRNNSGGGCGGGGGMPAFDVAQQAIVISDCNARNHRCVSNAPIKDGNGNPIDF